MTNLKSAPHQNTFDRPSVRDIHEILRKYEGLIVHFSGTPKGAGIDRGHIFPDDLNHVINGRAEGGLSCSVVRPCDKFSGEHRNATGCIGLILDLKTPQSLVAVSSTDCGSIEGPNGIRVVEKNGHITLSDVEASITSRSLNWYNEWVLKDFRVIGILAVPPYEIWSKVTIQKPKDWPAHMLWIAENFAPVCTTPSAIKNVLPNVEIFTFEPNTSLPLIDSKIYEVN